MDANTLTAYNKQAKTFAKDWLEQPAPDDMYELLNHYFKPGLTADIGCGAGRDTAWLSKNNFDVIGYDASAELLREARQHFPDVAFEFAALPGLEEIEPQKKFQNVLCETVIMHLEAQQVRAATRRLLDILRPQGTLFLSWRVTDGVSQRDKHQRLYSSFDAEMVLNECQGHTVLINNVEVSQSSGKTVHRVIVQKS